MRVISDGVLPITAVTMATNVGAAELSAWLEDMYLPPEVLAWLGPAMAGAWLMCVLLVRIWIDALRPKSLPVR